MLYGQYKRTYRQTQEAPTQAQQQQGRPAFRHAIAIRSQELGEEGNGGAVWRKGCQVFENQGDRLITASRTSEGRISPLLERTSIKSS